MENSILSLHDHRAHLFHGTCFKLAVWQGAGSHLSLGCVPTESLGLDLLYLTKLSGMVLCPTIIYQLMNIYFQFLPFMSRATIQVIKEGALGRI